MESFQHSQILVFRLFVSKIGHRHLANIIYDVYFYRAKTAEYFEETNEEPSAIKSYQATF